MFIVKFDVNIVISKRIINGDTLLHISNDIHTT